MVEIRRKFIDGLLGQVHVRQSKPSKASAHLPLICLHQSPKSGREFIDFMDVWGNDREIIAIDSPGHGESDLPLSVDGSTIENYARSAWSVLDKMGHNKIDLLGNHTGSSVAIEMATQQPDRVRRMVLISCPVYSTEEIETFRKLFQPTPMDEAGTRFQSMWKKSITYRGPGVSLEDLAISFAENFRAGEAYEWGHKAAFDYHATFADKLKNIKHRIIVINPNDLIFEATLRCEPYLQNGEIINYLDWGIGFLSAYTDDAVKAVREALEKA